MYVSLCVPFGNVCLRIKKTIRSFFVFGFCEKNEVIKYDIEMSKYFPCFDEILYDSSKDAFIIINGTR